MENQFVEMTQVGIVVRDLDAVIANMKKIFGCEPSFVGETLKSGRKYFGKEGNFAARIALFDFCNIQFEYMMPTEGESIWQDFLNEHGEGLQHVSFRVKNFEDAAAQMAQAGAVAEMQGLAMARPVRWDFFNTEQMLGFSVECASPMEHPEEHPKYPFGKG